MKRMRTVNKALAAFFMALFVIISSYWSTGSKFSFITYASEMEETAGSEEYDMEDFMKELRQMDFSKEALKKTSESLGEKIQIRIKKEEGPEIKSAMKRSAMNIAKGTISEVLRLIKKNIVYLTIIFILILILKIRKKRGD